MGIHAALRAPTRDVADGVCGRGRVGSLRGTVTRMRARSRDDERWFGPISSPSRALLSVLLPVLLVAATVGCVSLPGATTTGSEADRRSVAVLGEGKPVVVFESGLGNSKEVWESVFAPVAGFTRVVAYDRAGYGRSRGGSGERDGATIVSELRALLRELGLPPPYLLVGHSLGGQLVELYARLHPEEVVGVVLVDARSVDFSQRCLAERVERCTLPWLSRMLLPRGARAELAVAARTEEQIRAAGPFPAVPLRVLTATQRPAHMPNLRRVWAETQAELALLSPLGEQEICDTCGHFIQRDAPERVIEAIRSIVASTRE